MNPKPQGSVLTHPQQLGKYLIQGVLGEGGMGVVYKGYDPQLAREVAIKTIRRNLLTGKAGQELRERFNREAKAEGSLVHPNIVAVYEYQNDAEGTPFFVMEYVEGKTLKDYLSRGMHFNLDMAMHIISQLLSALAYSHKRGVVHRDIKPANIIWLEDDSIKIADFGIAKLDESEFTQTGQVLGTPQYASPELILGEKTDARSDLYSTALVFYELVSGVKPFASQSFSVSANLDDGHFDKLDMGDPELLRTFKTMIKKALARDPNKRFQSAEEFSAALQYLRMQHKALAPKPAALSVQSKTSAQTKKWWALGASSVLGLLLLMAAYFLSEPEPGLVMNSPDSLESAATQGKSVIESSEDKAVSADDSLLPNRQVLSAEQQEKVRRLLKTGDLHFKVGRVITPEGSNAFDAYQWVLELDPLNQQAQAGMQAIQEKILSQYERLVAQGELERAHSYLAHALRLFPENARLQALDKNLDAEAGSR